MKFIRTNSEVEILGSQHEIRGNWDHNNRSQNIMIPIEIGQTNRVIGFYPVTNQELPEGGQLHLNEITGTPFKAELAALSIIASPVLPDVKKSYIKALVSIADSIDRCEESQHSSLTEVWASRLAERIGLTSDEVQKIGLAAKLHDIGKAVVTKELLIKSGPLSTAEWVLMKKHPGYSAALLEPSMVLDPIRHLVRWHHERMDGRGYPDGLSGEQIPLGARIVAIADAFVSMISGRIYRDQIPSVEAMNELERCAGSQFDADLVVYMKEIIWIH